MEEMKMDATAFLMAIMAGISALGFLGFLGSGLLDR